MPALRSSLLGLDEATFRFLNGSLTWSLSWASLWAFLNTRTFDGLAGIVMGLFFLLPRLVYRGRAWIVAAFEFAGVFAVFSLVRLGLSVAFEPRFSPSRHFYPHINSLLELVPNVESKVFSEHSFPSDHAAVVFVWALFILYSSEQKGRFLAVPWAIFISLPRLVSGAHWLTDVLLGSTALAAVGFAWGYFTPLRAVMRRWGQALQRRLPSNNAL